VWIAVAFCWPVGFGLLVWALLALRSDELVTWRWAAGSSLVVIGASAFTLLRRWSHASDGLLISPDGLIVIDGPHHRVASRDEISDVVLEDGRLMVVYGPEQRQWCQYSAPVGSESHLTLERRLQLLRAWRDTGAIPSPNDPGHAPGKTPAFLGSVALSVAGSAALLGFLWLTLVLPATSASGRVARRFVQQVAAKDFDAAYALLAREKQQSLPRDRFESALSAQIRSASGFTVNGIATGGGRSCVDGWLADVEGSSGYAFDIVSEGDAERILDWGPGACHHD